MWIFAGGMLLLAVAVWLVVSQSKFGALPSGARLDRIKRSPNFRGGSFQNQHPTPTLTEGVSYASALKEFLFDSRPDKAPARAVPSVKTDLRSLPDGKDVLLWFGHSSYYLQTAGKRLLVDPVFSGSASPFAFTTRSFPGTDRYSASDFGSIDFLIITHDHWDHLDYATVSALRDRVDRVITGLGTGAHLEAWGYRPDQITELDWDESFQASGGFVFTAAPARHFSGRGLVRNRSLWISLVVQSPAGTLYLGGDSGYDTHFKALGERFGPFDLAILDNGQYDRNWRYVHMLPDEVLQAASDLRTNALLPVHNSKFVLGNHAWDAPLSTISRLYQPGGFRLLTPRIGEPVDWKDAAQVYNPWWATA